MSAKTRKTVNLALQGGGAHGAFTWGVLDRLLEDGRIDFEGVCGTSAGAMNAVVLAHGLRLGGAEAAREALEQFWHRVSKAARFHSPVSPLPLLDSPAAQQLGHWWFESFIRTLSPYQFNPFDFNPLRTILEEMIDFEALRACGMPQVFLCATNVRSGKVRIFRNPELSAQAVMASACLPFLFQAVEIEGEHYWDGGYMGNPALYPLFYHTRSSDIVVVHINPIRRDEVPSTPPEIANRVNEISFNSSLLREMRAVEFAARMVEQGWLKDEHAHRVRRLLIHSVRCDESTAKLPVASKLSPDWGFLTSLRDTGRRIADQWLADTFQHLGVRCSVDLREEFL